MGYQNEQIEANSILVRLSESRKIYKLAISATVILVAMAAFYLALTYVADRSVERNAERLATTWAQFFGSQFDGAEGGLATGNIEEQLAVLDRTQTVSDVFRFKLFDKKGELLYISDEPIQATAGSDLAAHNAEAAQVYVTGVPATFVEDGRAKPNRPDVYAESYVPVYQGGQIAGVVEVYVNQTANANEIRSMYLQFGGFVGMLILLIVAVPIYGLITTRRHLSQQNDELTLARDSALQAEKAKSEFLANMSHEIRTPMNGVLGMIELLAGTKQSSKQKSFTETARSSANSLLKIINDILDFSKVDAGQVTISAKEFKLSAIVNETAEMLSTIAFGKRVELLTRIDPNLPSFVVGDYDRIKQIAINLVGNAVKFTDFGEVAIDVSMVESSPTADGRFTLRLQVKDTGIGIKEDELDLVFGKFTQVDGSTTRAHEGTGLGLAICKGLVELMNGRVGVDSTLGEGSTFWIEVPLRVAEGATDLHSARPAEAKGKRVLVIDDNATNRWILAELLDSWQMDEISASSGQEGLQKLSSSVKKGQPIDLVLLDHHMPGMDGEEVLRHIRETPELAQIPVIALTSLDNFGSEQSRGKHAPDAMLVKPVGTSVLFDQIMVVLSKIENQTDASFIDETSDPLNTSYSKILVVEDNPVNQAVAREMLKTLGFVPTIAQDGREGVKAWRACKPSLVLMDVSMPIASGIEATGMIRKIESEEGLSPTYIAGMTAHAMQGDRDRCIDAGMDDYIPKPINLESLRDVLIRSGVLDVKECDLDVNAA